MGGIYTMIY